MEQNIQEIINSNTYDQNANTQLMNQLYDSPTEHRSYICCIYNQPKIQLSSNAQFQDIQFSINLEKVQDTVDPNNQIILKRISQIFHTNFCPSLFPNNVQKTPATINSNNANLPHFAYQLRHFNIFWFKRLFITQEISMKGIYQILVNKDGVFEIQTVDDLVPLYKKNRVSIWGLDIEEPWQLVLAKVWAKRVGGYENIQYTKPFQFIQYFSPSNWKYLNLHRQGRLFLSQYYDKLGKTCRILLKTKKQTSIEKCGLVAGELAFQLMELDRYDQRGKGQYNIMIKSVFHHCWTGNLSIFDGRFKIAFQRFKNNYELQTTFMVTPTDFFNIFSSAFITAKETNSRQYVKFHKFSVPSCNPKPFYFRFYIQNNGYFIFNIVQGNDNRNYESCSNIPIYSILSLSSLRMISEKQFSSRHLKIKYIISMDLDSDNSQQKSSKSIKNKGYFLTDQQLNSMLKYKLCDFDFTKGYNKGDSHPVLLKPGAYLFRIQIQETLNQPNFTIQYVSHENITLYPFSIEEKEQKLCIKHSFMSIRHHVPSQPLISQLNGSIFFGNQFNQLGFGFIGVVFFHRQPSDRLLIHINPVLLKREGYRFSLQYRQKKEQFIVQMEGGEFQMFVLVRIDDGRKQSGYIWPCSAFKFFLSQNDLY